MAKKKKQFEKYFEHQRLMEKGSRHHIRPSSRGGNGCQDNIAWVNEDLHQRFHSLFHNRLPEECIEFLVEYFFNGNYDILEKVLREKEVEYVCYNGQAYRELY
jgi:hypothetical protein